ncbi:MAG: hypothetical protein MHPSP_001052 [Paramarteilia canceri]
MENWTPMHIMPCLCKDSLATVHNKCLVKWMSHKLDDYCEICKTKLPIDRKKLKPIKLWKKLKLVKSDVFDLAIASVEVIVIFILVVRIISLFLEITDRKSSLLDIFYVAIEIVINLISCQVCVHCLKLVLESGSFNLIHKWIRLNSKIMVGGLVEIKEKTASFTVD